MPMKNLSLIIFFLIIASCAKTPSAEEPGLRRDLLIKPQELLFQKLSLSKKYTAGSEYLTFFLWPTGLSRDELKHVAEGAAELGTDLDRNIETQYALTDTKFKLSHLEAKIEEIEEERDEKLDLVIGLFLKKFDDEEPYDCDGFGEPPWADLELVDSCNEQFSEIEEQYDEMIEVLEDEMAFHQKTINNVTNEFTNILDDFSKVLESKPMEPETWKNWIKCKSVNTWEYPKGSHIPNIKLNIMFNNGVKRKYLSYSSTSTGRNKRPDIVDVKMEMKNLIPTLSFKLFEKAMVSRRERARTGFFYEMSLRRSVLDHSLQYQGDVYKFDKSGKLMAKGMVAIRFKVSARH
jgi:hypothetical protein